MKLKTIIDGDVDERVEIYAKERTSLVCEIERLVTGMPQELIGYRENEIVRLDISRVDCFFSENNKIFALVEGERYSVRERLYVIEETVGSSFIRINQSCIVNVSRIERFEASFSGALLVIMKCGYKDYISRRQLKNVKERIGFKL